MDKRLFSLLLMGCAACATYAQDPRESHYYYEVLDPRHEAKPLTEGFATERVTERLNRGLTATPATDGKSVYLSWRLLDTDAPTVSFNVYRESSGKTKRLNRKPITKTCDFTDKSPAGEATYWVEATGSEGTTNGKATSNRVKASANGMKQYTSIPIADGETPGKLAIADLDGDGTYDFIVRTPNSNVDPGMPGDKTGKTYRISAYLSTGRHLWTIDLGQGIEPGVWYSPFVAFDFNGDGKAEVAFKSSGDDYVKNEQGRVCGGSEYLTVVDGMTGKTIDRVDWPERNDRYGNLVRMMNQEGCREKGHLQINKIVMQQLVELNAQLLQSTKFPFYNSEYYKVLPFIVELRRRGADNEENEIETCFNALYGVMMLRLQKKKISPDTEHAIKEISTFVGMLSDYYLKDKKEPLEFD